MVNNKKASKEKSAYEKWSRENSPNKKSPCAKYMLDTNICIYAIKHKPANVIQRLMEHDPAELCISSITYAELIHGVEKSLAVDRNRLALALLLSNIQIMDFDSSAAECYGKVRADLEKKGTPIGPLDTLIAGHALSLKCILVTNKTKEFLRIDHLNIEDWATEITE